MASTDARPIHRKDLSMDMPEGETSFPPTQWTLIRESSKQNPANARQSMDALAQLYWRPVYAFLRSKWQLDNEDAKDLTQDFFMVLWEKDIVQRLVPEAGRFRSYVRAALDNFVRSRYHFEGRIKRGGSVFHRSLGDPEAIRVPTESTPDDLFRQQWKTSLLMGALDRMRNDYVRREVNTQFQMFLAFEVDPPGTKPPSYQELAKQFGVSQTDVRNYLYRARKAFRNCVCDLVSESVTTEQEAKEELRELFDADAE